MRSIKIGYVTNSSNDVAFIVYKTNIIPTVDEIKDILREDAEEFIKTYIQYLKLSGYENKTIEEIKQECLDKLAKTLHQMLSGCLESEDAEVILDYICEVDRERINELHNQGYMINATDKVDDKMYGPDLAIIRVIDDWCYSIQHDLENLGVDVKFLERVHLG